MVAPPLAAMREALVADALHAGQAQTAGELVGLRVVEIGPGGRESNGRAAGRRDRRSVTSDTQGHRLQCNLTGVGRAIASPRPRISIPRGRHGSVLARSSITIAARPVRATSRNFLVCSSSWPPMSMASRAAL
jgi:hypothetical protein